MTQDNPRSRVWLDAWSRGTIRAVLALRRRTAPDRAVTVRALQFEPPTRVARLLASRNIQVGPPVSPYLDNAVPEGRKPPRYSYCEALDRLARDAASPVRVANLQRFLRRPGDGERLAAYVGKTAVDAVKPLVYDLAILRREAEKTSPADSHAYVLRKRPGAQAFVDLWDMKPNERVVYHGRSPRIRPAARALMGLAVDAAFAAIRGWRRGKSPAAPEAAKRRVVAVEAYKFRMRDQNNDLIWWDPQLVRADEIVMYAATATRQPEPQFVNWLEAQGIRWVDVRTTSPRIHRWRARRLWASLARVPSLLVRCLWRPGLSVVDARDAAMFERAYTLTRAFVKHHNVGVRISYTGTPASLVPEVLALQDENALDVTHPWSAWDSESPWDGLLPAKHAYLAWGPSFVDKLLRFGNAPEALVFIGSLPSSLVPRLTAAANERRARLAGPRRRTIVAVLDNFPSKMIMPPDSVKEFYDTVLGLALRHDLGVVLKPKGETIKRRPGLDQLAEALRRRGRFEVLDPTRPAVEAAISADLCIGFGINTAVLEGAAAGTPGIHVDTVGTTGYFLHASGGGRVVARTTRELEAMLERFLREGPRSGVGDHGPFRDLTDPYGDTAAPTRSCQFLRFFLDAPAGTPTLEAVREALVKYRRIWGHKSALFEREMMSDQPLLNQTPPGTTLPARLWPATQVGANGGPLANGNSQPAEPVVKRPGRARTRRNVRGRPDPRPASAGRQDPAGGH